VTWTAVLGRISTSGLYTAPTVTRQQSDTVSAISIEDPTKYTNADVAITIPQTSTGGPYTIFNQQPATFEFNSGSIFTTPLPVDVGQHLLTNSSDIVSNIFGGDQTAAMVTLLATDPQSYNGIPGYYSDARDPVYKWTGCSSHPNAPFDPTGMYFHLKPGLHHNGSYGDESFNDWDQSTDLYPKQRWLNGYWFNAGGAVVANPNCRATTPAEADADPTNCVIPFYSHHCAVGYPLDDAVAINEGPSPWDSADVGPPAGFLRDREIMAGTINHALWLNTRCVSGPNVFPSTGYGPCHCGTNECSYSSGISPVNRPAGGALFWIDNAYDCGALPAWQKGVCKTMQVYGAYISDTGGSYDNEGVWVVKAEGPTAYQDAGISFPLFDWLLSQPGLTCSGGICYDQPNSSGMTVSQNKTRATLRWFNMPGVLSHLHVVDPCVPKAMAGASGGCQ
jgi:hypothetical protein